MTIFRRVDSCLLVLSRLAICRLGWQSLLVILDTSRFDPNADQLCCGCSGFGLNVKQRTYSSGACVTEYYSCSHSLYRPGMPSEVWDCG